MTDMTNGSGSRAVTSERLLTLPMHERLVKLDWLANLWTAPDGTPMANAMLSLIHSLGMTDVQSFGDSTGEFTF